jgi:hypothetical protein
MRPHDLFLRTKRPQWCSLGLGSLSAGGARVRRPYSIPCWLPFDATQTRREIGEVEKRSALDGLPLRRRMTVMVTTGRLIVWTADWRMHNLKARSGELSLSRIASASRPFVGGGRWKTIQIRTRETRFSNFRLSRHRLNPYWPPLPAECPSTPGRGHVMGCRN